MAHSPLHSPHLGELLRFVLRHKHFIVEQLVLQENLTIPSQVLVLHLCLSLLELTLIYKLSNPYQIVANQILCIPVLSDKLKYRATTVVKGSFNLCSKSPENIQVRCIISQLQTPQKWVHTLT